MTKAIWNYLKGIGSVLVILPPPRDLSVRNPAASSTEEAFARDAEAIASDFERAIANGTDLGRKDDSP